MSDITARFEQINTPDHVKNLVEEAREFMRSALGETALQLGYLQRASEVSALWEYDSDDQLSLLGINFVGNALIIALYRRQLDQPTQVTHASLVVENGNTKLFKRTSYQGIDGETSDMGDVERFGAQVLAVTKQIRDASAIPIQITEPVVSENLQAA